VGVFNFHPYLPELAVPHLLRLASHKHDDAISFSVSVGKHLYAEESQRYWIKKSQVTLSFGRLNKWFRHSPIFSFYIKSKFFFKRGFLLRRGVVPWAEKGTACRLTNLTNCSVWFFTGRCNPDVTMSMKSMTSMSIWWLIDRPQNLQSSISQWLHSCTHR